MDFCWGLALEGDVHFQISPTILLKLIAVVAFGSLFHKKLNKQRLCDLPTRKHGSIERWICSGVATLV
jgi:hypothetical protein